MRKKRNKRIDIVQTLDDNVRVLLTWSVCTSKYLQIQLKNEGKSDKSKASHESINQQAVVVIYSKSSMCLDIFGIDVIYIKY